MTTSTSTHPHDSRQQRILGLLTSHGGYSTERHASYVKHVGQGIDVDVVTRGRSTIVIDRTINAIATDGSSMVRTAVYPNLATAHYQMALPPLQQPPSSSRARLDTSGSMVD